MPREELPFGRAFNVLGSKWEGTKVVPLEKNGRKVWL